MHQILGHYLCTIALILLKFGNSASATLYRLDSDLEARKLN
jgi:hypothetical protein